MSTVSISQLKANPSLYVRQVQRGGEVQIAVRGKPVARLVGVLSDGDNHHAKRQRLIDSGLLRPGQGRVNQLLGGAPPKMGEVELVSALLDSREDRV